MVVLVLTGCSRVRPKAQWTDRLLKIQSNVDAGDYSKAERQYHALLDKTDHSESKRHIYFQLGELSVKQGEIEKARDWYQKVRQGGYRDQLAAEAYFDTLKISADTTYTDYRRLIRIYPDSLYAEYALEKLQASLLDKNRESELLSHFSSLYVLTKQNDIADQILFHWARLHRERLNNPQEALNLLRKLRDSHPQSPLANDALWQIAKLYESHQMWHSALRVHSIMAGHTGDSLIIEDYDGAFAKEARRRRGLIYMLFLDEYDNAIAEFERFQRDFPKSLYLDDVAWHIIEAHRLSNESKRYRKKIKAFRKTFPKSRYNRRIRDRFPKLEDTQ